MNGTLTTWMLAGALAASLAWNARSALREPEAPPARPTARPAECSAAIDVAQLELSEAQRSALAQWNATACAASCQLDAEAELRWSGLQAALRDPGASAEDLRALAAEVSRLRAQALEACVDSILAVRRVLTEQQLSELIACCGSCRVGER